MADNAKRIFADLMAVARTRPLTVAERARLSKARQLLRRARRPAMNPRKKSKWSLGQSVFVDAFKTGGMLARSLPPYVFSEPGIVHSIVKNRVEVKYDSGKSFWFDDDVLSAVRLRMNPRTVQRRRRIANGGPKRVLNNSQRTMIYGKVLEIICQRVGPHRCDRKCKAVSHRYRHVFKTRPAIYGNDDGSLTIR